MPLAFGSHRSKLVEVLHSGRVQQAGEALPGGMAAAGHLDRSNGPYHDRFINKRQEPPPYDLPRRSATGSGDRGACTPAMRGRATSRPHVTRLVGSTCGSPSAACSSRAVGQGGRRQRQVPQLPCADRSDPDYAAVERLVQGGGRKAWACPAATCSRWPRRRWRGSRGTGAGRLCLRIRSLRKSDAYGMNMPQE